MINFSAIPVDMNIGQKMLSIKCLTNNKQNYSISRANFCWECLR